MKEGADEEKACRGDCHHSPGFHNNQLFFKRRKAGLDRCMLYAAGVSIRNSVRPSLRKKRKHVKSRMLQTPALFARDLPNCG